MNSYRTLLVNSIDCYRTRSILLPYSHVKTSRPFYACFMQRIATILCYIYATLSYIALPYRSMSLTHWGRVTHICVVKLTIFGSDNGLSPGRRQAIIWTNAGILLIGPLGTNFIEILIGIQTFSFKKMHLKMSSEKWRPFCLGLNVLMSNHIH